MNIKKTFLAALVAMGCMTATAQEANTEYVFNPHWYLQVQGGAQETLGEVSFSDLLSPNAQLGIGYQFNKVIGARLALNAWQSKGGSELNNTTYNWKWNYVAPTIDATFNLSNLFSGYNPERTVNFSVFAGLGANVAFGNDEAQDVSRTMVTSFNRVAADGTPIYTVANDDQYLRLLWDGTKPRLTGRVGCNVDFRLSDAVSLGIELSSNAVHDAYNSKKAKNVDWYFNGLVGLKYTFGKSYSKKAVEKEPCCTCPPPAEPKVIERVVEKVVQVPANDANSQKMEKVAEPLRRDIFFLIRATKISDEEMVKVREIADYLKENPQAKVVITGYADKGTGNATINRNLSIGRAKAVADTLKTKFGIDASRISTDAKGDTEQPFAEEVKNRVSICIAE